MNKSLVARLEALETKHKEDVILFHFIQYSTKQPEAVIVARHDSTLSWESPDKQTASAEIERLYPNHKNIVIY